MKVGDRLAFTFDIEEVVAFRTICADCPNTTPHFDCESELIRFLDKERWIVVERTGQYSPTATLCPTCGGINQ